MDMIHLKKKKNALYFAAWVFVHLHSMNFYCSKPISSKKKKRDFWQKCQNLTCQCHIIFISFSLKGRRPWTSVCNTLVRSNQPSWPFDDGHCPAQNSNSGICLGVGQNQQSCSENERAAKRNRLLLLRTITLGTGLKEVFVCPRGGLNGMAWSHRVACGLV